VVSTLATEWVPVPSLYTGAQIVWFDQEWIVLEVLAYPAPLSGWVVIAKAVNDFSAEPRRVPLSYANSSGLALLAHRVAEVAR
jgi:hypothetical protein